MWKKKYSDGDYVISDDAKTFEVEFYYINFIDKVGKFESRFSEKLDNKVHAYNRAKWLSKNRWSLSRISYNVVQIGVYSGKRGHIKTYTVE